MSNLLDLLVAGLATGAIYAIAAVGFTLLWQTSQTINFAQGEFVMLPAFLMLAANLRALHKAAEQYRTAKTNRIGMILPEMQAAPHRDTRPVHITVPDHLKASSITPGGIFVPDGARIH